MVSGKVTMDLEMLRFLALCVGVDMNFIWSKDITSKISCMVGLTIINIVIPFSDYYMYCTCIGLVQGYWSEFTPVCLQPLSLIQEEIYRISLITPRPCLVCALE